eukprot:TRINITY_DN53938_c0_g1_i1.p1 TRINITY_DN53938_c0_g1~~TRINITY_DN53938_c0_g1_i1.p1  ORF type:complete len:386 (-),score=70.23 TRINITY_DN53938_c0_g1_i1:59-1216(-)
MPKKQQKGDADSEETKSVASEEQVSQPVTNEAAELIEILWGKQSAQARARALQSLISHLQSLRNLEDFEGRIETLLHYSQKIFSRKGTTGERSGACRLVGIASFTLDAPSPESWTEISSDLLATARDPVVQEEARVMALEALSVCAITNPFSCAHEGLDALINGVASIFERNVTKADEGVISAALRCFGLLICIDPANHFARLKECESHLLDLLQRPAVPVVLAAGELLALLFEIARDTGAKRGGGMAPQVLEALAGEVGKIGKSQRHEIAPALRSVLAFIEGEEDPYESLTVSGHKLEFTSWKELLLLSAFRNVLGSGLPIHLQYNPRVRAIFHIEKEFDPPKRTKLQKKALQEETSAAEKQRKIVRAKHTRQQISRVFEEEED